MRPPSRKKQSLQSVGRRNKLQGLKPAVTGDLLERPTAPPNAFHAMNLWQFADWRALSEIRADDYEKAKESQKVTMLAASANFQLGMAERGKRLLVNAKRQGSSRKDIAKTLIAGAHLSLGKASFLLSRKNEKISRHFTQAVSLALSEAVTTHSVQAIQSESLRNLTFSIGPKQLKALEASQQKSLHDRPDFDGINTRSKPRKKLFIDCGGHDGCSVVKFLLQFPDFDVITFEPNPDLWPYYEELPGKLIKKAVFTEDGEVEMIFDPVDADGSSIVPNKKIDFYGSVENESCPKVIVPTIDLSAFIKQQSACYDEIALKLDVEGAEYDLLEKLLDEGSIRFIQSLYCEFHWNKCGISKERHEKVLREVAKCVEIQSWDASEFSVHQKPSSNNRMRAVLINSIATFSNLADQCIQYSK